MVYRFVLCMAILTVLQIKTTGRLKAVWQKIKRNKENIQLGFCLQPFV